jgi:ferritin
MKDLLRLRTSLTEEMEITLNHQIRQEAKASAIYLAMASWCDGNGYIHSADFFYKQSEEERSHMLKIFKYVNDVGGKALSPEVNEIPQEFESLRSVFENFLELEILNTQSINHVLDRCYKIKDFATLKFMQWFVDEQVEEEYIARRILELFELIGTEGMGLYTIDKKVLEVQFPK